MNGSFKRNIRDDIVQIIKHLIVQRFGFGIKEMVDEFFNIFPDRHRKINSVGFHQGLDIIGLIQIPRIIDQHFNVMDPDDIPSLNTTQLNATPAEGGGQFQPIVLLKVKSAEGTFIQLCDFATAGAYGTHYRSWLPVE